MSVAVAKANLADALKQLRIKWAKVQQQWDDDARREFEKDYLEGLEPRVVAAIKGMEHVTELMAQVMRECGEDRGELIG
jgi:hypothetical protein